ncbi:MAG: outer membrane lipoprotein chaperone LolA [Porticoccaceae bacterium]
MGVRTLGACTLGACALLLVLVPTHSVAEALSAPASTPAPVPVQVQVQCLDGSAELKNTLDKMQSLSTEFRQLMTSADGHPLQDMSGVMHISKPGRIHWATEAPFEQLVIADGESLWLYDPDLEQVTVKSLEVNLTNSPAALLLGDSDSLAETYKICRETVENTTRISLTPLQIESVYTEIVLAFVAETPTAIIMNDSLGQRTVVTLIDAVMNPQLDTALFVFDPPAGIDIFEDR